VGEEPEQHDLRHIFQLREQSVWLLRSDSWAPRAHMGSRSDSRCDAHTTHENAMIKFYYAPAPNPAKVALFSRRQLLHMSWSPSIP